MEPSMQQMQSNTLSVPNFLQYPIVNYLPLFSRSKHSFHCANIGPHSAVCPFGSLRYIQRLTQFSLAQERWTQALYALSSRVDRPVLDTRCSRLESACFALWWLLIPVRLPGLGCQSLGHYWTSSGDGRNMSP
jgi:hypothetical protein